MNSQDKLETVSKVDGPKWSFFFKLKNQYELWLRDTRWKKILNHKDFINNIFLINICFKKISSILYKNKF